MTSFRLFMTSLSCIAFLHIFHPSINSATATAINKAAHISAFKLARTNLSEIPCIINLLVVSHAHVLLLKDIKRYVARAVEPKGFLPDQLYNRITKTWIDSVYMFRVVHGNDSFFEIHIGDDIYRTVSLQRDEFLCEYLETGVKTLSVEKSGAMVGSIECHSITEPPSCLPSAGRLNMAVVPSYQFSIPSKCANHFRSNVGVYFDVTQNWCYDIPLNFFDNAVIENVNGYFYCRIGPSLTTLDDLPFACNVVVQLPYEVHLLTYEQFQEGDPNVFDLSKIRLSPSMEFENSMKYSNYESEMVFMDYNWDEMCFHPSSSRKFCTTVSDHACYLDSSVRKLSENGLDVGTFQVYTRNNVYCFVAYGSMGGAADKSYKLKNFSIVDCINYADAVIGHGYWHSVEVDSLKMCHVRTSVTIFTAAVATFDNISCFNQCGMPSMTKRCTSRNN